MDDVTFDSSIKGVPQPNRECTFVDGRGDDFVAGPVSMKIIEDGSNTDNRLAIIRITLPPRMKGPPAHWHEMHDEIFMVTKGKVRFHVSASHPTGEPAPEGESGKVVDVGVGDTMTVPTRAPHTFSNPFDEEAVFLNTMSPAFYVNYLRMISTLLEPGKPMDPNINLKAMAHFATVSADLKK